MLYCETEVRIDGAKIFQDKGCSGIGFGYAGQQNTVDLFCTELRKTTNKAIVAPDLHYIIHIAGIPFGFVDVDFGSEDL